MNTQYDIPFVYSNPEWLKQQIEDILGFYYPRCIDKENGGFFQCFLDDGTICDYQTKNLIGTSRFIYIFSIGAMIGHASWCIPAIEHGIKFMQEHHLDKKYGGLFWTLDGTKASDSSKLTYGHAFAFLAVSKAYQAGVKAAYPLMQYLYDIAENYLFEEEHQLYLDEYNRDWSTPSSYRGQNANMHMCEAMIAAYEATSEKKYLTRAYTLAKNVTVHLTSQSGGLIWEHYDADWKIDWDYKEQNQSLKEFRPNGFILGHSIEWSKLLLMLERHISEPWITAKSSELYELGFKKGYDSTYGGLYMSLTKEEKLLDTDKTYWVIAESIGASALSAKRLQSASRQKNYETLLTYAGKYFVDQKYGGWYQLLNRENHKYSNVKSPVNKTDYHPIANYYEAIRAFS
ncbi:AGE family epimerase/isomerase [Niallia sp. 03133]|uniref:AGE family epimerase/isomerase n=1 Tax=Niallia sp. 03133 TaxID=3458060 RepID=UPI004044EE61